MRREAVPVYLIHWNAPEWCASAARSILGSAGVSVDLTIVDNGQTDGQPLEQLIPPGVRILRTRGNPGYSGAANVALLDWRRRLPESELCLIGSHDLHVRYDTLGKLIRAADTDPNIGILAPALVSPFKSSGGCWTGWRAFQLPLDPVPGIVERDYVSGTCMLLRRECVDSVRGFDEAFGSYAEDVDIGLRAGDAGWKVGVLPHAVAWGLGSVSSSASSMSLANGVLLVAKRSGPVIGTLRALVSLTWLAMKLARRAPGTMAFWRDEDKRRASRMRFSQHTFAAKRILSIVGKAWAGNMEVVTRPSISPEELVGRKPVSKRRDAAGGPNVDTRKRSGPVASIILTTKDRPAYANRALASALSQTVGDIEVIVIDDGSVEPFKPTQADPRVRVLRQEASFGVCAARNRGLDDAGGYWILFLDDDDELLPHMLATSLRAMEESGLPPPVAVLSGQEVVDAEGRITEVRLPVTLPQGSHYFMEDGDGRRWDTVRTLVSERGLFKAIGGWDEELRAWEDDDLFLRLNAACSIQGIPDVTYRVTEHRNRRLQKNHVAAADAMARTVAKHRDVFASHPSHFGHYLAAICIAYARAGRWATAFGAMARFSRDYLWRPRVGTYWAISLVRIPLSLYWRRTVATLNSRRPWFQRVELRRRMSTL